jgi:hypothetical protein
MSREDGKGAALISKLPQRRTGAFPAPPPFGVLEHLQIAALIIGGFRFRCGVSCEFGMSHSNIIEEVTMRKSYMIWVCVLVLTLGAAGCSTQTKTVTAETRQYPDESAVENRTETTTTETRAESGGVLSSTVDVVGEVLALPFRAVGGLLRGIF